MSSSLVTRLRHRATAVRADGDRGSLVLAMLVVLVATSIAALVLPMFLNSAGAARFDDARARQLAAAQSGVETTLARIRAAAGATGSDGANGDRRLLPCAPILGTVTAAVNGTAKTTLRYRATVQYFTTDPAVATATGVLPTAVACAVGAGPSTVTAFPGYARITSSGSDVAGTTFPVTSTRTVSATYVVKTTNANIVGGLVHVAQYNGSADLCLDAGKAPFTAGRAVTMQSCTTGAAGQMFAYRPSLTLTLTATVTASDPLGMCVDGGPRKQVDGYAVVLQACAKVATPQQQWSNNDYANFVGTDDGSTLNGKCLNVANPNKVGSAVVVNGNCGKAATYYDNVRNWLPDASVGAGAAGASTNQLVNYGQFGRCLDVPGYDTNATNLIAWPCKQAPDPANVLWNQKWQLPTLTAGSGTGVITTNPGSLYCLRSNHQSGGNVRIVPCPPNAATDQQYVWKVRTQVATYAASYQIEDAWGQCLQPEATTAAQQASGTVSTIVLAACSASTLQKWNAPPNVDAPSVKDQTEN